MTNETNERNEQPEKKRSFKELVAPVLTDLFYPSESDEPLEPVTCYLDQAEPLTSSQIKDWLLLAPPVYVDELPEADFWEPVITDEDWYGEDEKKRTATFQQLKAILESELTDRQVFRVGHTEMELYLLGRPDDGERAGLKTRIIET